MRLNLSFSVKINNYEKKKFNFKSENNEKNIFSN